MVKILSTNCQLELNLRLSGGLGRAVVLKQKRVLRQTYREPQFCVRLLFDIQFALEPFMWNITHTYTHTHTHTHTHTQGCNDKTPPSCCFKKSVKIHFIYGSEANFSIFALDSCLKGFFQYSHLCLPIKWPNYVFIQNVPSNFLKKRLQPQMIKTSGCCTSVLYFFISGGSLPPPFISRQVGFFCKKGPWIWMV